MNQKNGKTAVSKERFTEALQQSGGFLSYAARICGVSRWTARRYVTRWHLEEFLEDITEELGDIAEAKLIQLIKQGDGPSIRFYLETKHKHRGYTRRVENTGKDGEPIQVQSADERNAKLRDFSDDDLRRLADELERRERQKAH
ncbi:MAG: hypothetical protein KDJ74_01035 [Notoacmeibacter sp.]|nr:hypothetical protein [Notoacmeibacter sp.]